MSTPACESYDDFKKNIELHLQSGRIAPVVGKTAPVVSAPAASPFVVVAALGLFAGYLATSVMLINDIYFGGIQVDGQIRSSPVSVLQLGESALIALYIIGSIVTVGAAIIVARYKMPPSGGILLLFCPLILAVYFTGQVLRESGFLARYIACVYLLGGTCLMGTAALYFVNNPAPLTSYSHQPMLSSVSLHAGLALMICSILSLIRDNGQSRVPSA